MKKSFLVVTLLPFLFACTQQAKQDTPVNLIVPGKGIGTMALYSNADSIVNVMGKPDRSDGPVGSMVNTWYAKHDTAAARITIFSNKDNENDKVTLVKKIIVTSPEYKTPEGIGVGATLNEIGKYYGVRSTGATLLKGRPTVAYSALDKGIGFQVDNDTRKCVAISVFGVQDAAVAYTNVY